MDSERWREISDLAALAAEAGAEERSALLHSRPDLRAEVESLLRYLDDGSGPLDRPAEVSPGGYEDRKIGQYRILRELGRGGMGVVLLARREGVDFEQLVAIKLSRISFQSEFFALRFQQERRILARLEHPNIARLLDGGVADDGTPYLVLQYVEGVALHDYCAAHGLDIEARIRLVIEICGAVQFAHENLIVHRDLKPGNILVNAKGQPVLLDFGTARLLDPEGETGTTATALPAITARYASPEQVQGRAGSVRSDVYSLAVVLYELLTSEWPYEAESSAVPSLLRAVAEQQPIRPSRRVSLPSTRRFLNGDLDAILIKALDKQPERRYGSVQQFAADLQRRLDNQPVEARNPTEFYRAKLFLRRHRAAAAAAVLFVAGLAASTVYSVWQARIADRERANAVQVAMFLEQLLGASPKGGVSALASGGRELKVVDVIEQAAARVGDEFRNSPDIEVGLRSTIASALMVLGYREKAAPNVARAVEIAERLYGDNHAVTVRALTARGRLRMSAGDYKGAQTDLERTMAWYARVNHPEIAFQHNLLGEACYRQGDVASARRHFEVALQGMRTKFGDRHITTATMISNLAVMTDDGGDAVTAEKYFQEAAGVLRALPGPPGNLVYPLIGLARAHFFRGEYAQAESLAGEAHQHAVKTAGPRHPNTMAPALQLALIRAHQGDAHAEAAALETVAVERSIFPPGHIEISRGLTTLGRILILRGRSSQAIPLLREAHGIARKVFPRPNWRPAESQLFLGAAFAMTGKSAEARTMLEEAFQEMSAVLPASHPRVVEASRIRTRCLAPAERPCTI